MSSARQLLTSLASSAFFLGILLISAGRLDYWQAWLYGGVSVVMSVGMRIVLRQDAGLATERSKPGPGAQPWDKKLLGLGLLLSVAALVVAGLDSGRWHWTPNASWVWAAVGAGLSIAGTFLFLLALRENRFFSAVVRIQSDRGHTVCRTGPYAVIRHPGNAGMILGTMGFPFLFVSAWSALPVALSILMLVVRTHLEDALLARELEGYRDYMLSTRFRLVPGLW